MNILVLGATGLIGSQVYRVLSKKNKVYGTYNNNNKIKKIKYNKSKLFYFNASYKKNLIKIIDKIKPDLVINCIGITKHIKNVNKNKIFKVNGSFPHQAKKISNERNAKFIQISTDCVFDGKRGNYKETSKPNANDLYGKSKASGEINDNFNLTLRTSTIGHEFHTKYGLLEWFLSQKIYCNGYSKAVFNGFPTFYFAKILQKIILKKDLNGLMHVSGDKINKYKLLKKINNVYKKNIVIRKDSTVKINRSLNNKLFKSYFPKDSKNWDSLIKDMKKEHGKSKFKF